MHHAPVEGSAPFGHSHAHGPAAHAHHPDPDHPHPAPHTHSVQGMEAHRPRQRRALVISMAVTVAMMAAEVAGGLVTGSLMLLSDAVHMGSHAVSLGVSWLAIWMAARPRTSRSHYGLHRFEILGSLFNAIGLLVVTGWIVFEAVERFTDLRDIRTLEMIGIALAGLAVNVVTALILARSGAEDLNTKSALYHMLGDLLSSVVIVVGGVVLLFTGWAWIDPALSLLVAALVLYWGLGLLRESVSILLERAPKGMEPEVLQAAMIASVPGVRGVHDLHVWEITSGYVCLTAHVVIDDLKVSDSEAIRGALCEMLWSRFRVSHVTLQVETA